VRLALVGAFPFPLAQGSQVYFAEQGRALADAGARVTIVCYGRGTPDGGASGAGTPRCGATQAPGVDAAARPAAARIERITTPRALTPRRLGSGASPAKPIADAALAAALVAAHRCCGFDAVLAHNAEAAVVALAVRPLLRRPVVYVAHTLWAHELAAHLPPRWGAAAGRIPSRLGALLDACLARRADAVIAVSTAGARRLGAHARGPVVCLPPSLRPEPEPTPDAVASTCRRHGLAPGRYAVYTGNLDRYQALDVLVSAAALLRAPVVVATHAGGTAPAPLRTVHVADSAEARRLLFGAGVALLPRRAPGGFPVKLLNYLEARRPVVARAGVADGLVDGRSAWLVADDASPGAFAEAVEALLADPVRAERLGAAGRAHLEAAHAPAPLAERTLALVARLVG
jgi:glycosyltransferase involved in cell wall biosynthesis